MSKNLDYIRKDVAKGESFHLTFFNWKNHTSVELGQSVVAKRGRELGQSLSSSTCSLPAYVFERIPANIIEELDGMGLLKGKDYNIQDFVKDYGLNIERRRTTPIPGTSSFAVEWVDISPN